MFRLSKRSAKPGGLTNARPVAKALSWRVVGSLTTSAIVYAVTRKLLLSLAVGAAQLASELGLAWLQERWWVGRRDASVDPRPLVIWFTGLSGSGKTTVARFVADRLRTRGLRVEQLDGDTIRDIFPDTGFTKPERDAHIKRVGYLASRLEVNGVFVVASLVSPYEESRNFVRGLCRNFVEIHVSTPLEVCQGRDAKGLYAQARRGAIRSFTGIDDPYEPPTHPDLVLDTTTMSVPQAGARVLDLVGRRTRNGG